MTTVGLPQSLISTLPGRYYTDPAIFALEQERIFEGMWFCAVRAGRPGQAGGLPDRADRPGERARHRGPATARSARSSTFAGTAARTLCTEESGEVKRAFQCPYHAWTYDLDGKLIAAPNLTKMPDIDRVRVRPAPESHVREWLGYVWVCLADEAAVVRGGRDRQDVGDRLGDVDVDRPLRRRQPRASAAGSRYDVQGELEAHHRELHGVLPLRHHPPGAHRGAAGVRRRAGGAVLRRATAPSSARTSRDSPSTAREGSTASPASPTEQDRRYYAITVKPQVFVNLVPDHVIVHRMFPMAAGPHHRRMRLAVPAPRGRVRQGRQPLGRAVPPGQPAGLRGMRALPAGDELTRLPRRRRAGAQRAPHRRVPRLAASEADEMTAPSGQSRWPIRWLIAAAAATTSGVTSRIRSSVNR